MFVGLRLKLPEAFLGGGRLFLEVLAVLGVWSLDPVNRWGSLDRSISGHPAGVILQESNAERGSSTAK